VSYDAGSLLGFIGAVGFGPTTFTYPPAMWLILKKPSPKSWQFWASWFCVSHPHLACVSHPAGDLMQI